MKWLKDWAEKTPENLFINQLTYKQAFEKVESLLPKVASISESRIAFPMRNDEDELMHLFALIAVGKEVLLVNPNLTDDELKGQITPLGINYLLNIKNLIETAEVFTTNWDSGLENIAVLMNTSATTGNFKTVPITWQMIDAQVKASAKRIGVLKDDNWLAVLPIFHVSGLSIIMRTLYNGTRATLVEKFDENLVVDLINDGEINMASMVPTMLGRIIDRIDENKNKLRMLLLGGEFIPQPLIDKAFAMRLPIFKTYGMTETFSQSVTFNILDEPDKLDSVGLPLPGVLVDVLNPDSDGVGTIMIKSPMLMKGYLNKEPLPEIGFDTGDIGYLDDDKYLYILNRRKDIIISGGENIYPKEIENIVYGIKGIKEVALMPRQDDKWGQIPILYFSGTAEPKDILESLDGRISRFKMPKEIIKMKTLPKNPSGKILRKDLK